MTLKTESKVQGKLTFKYSSKTISDNVSKLIQFDNEMAPKTLAIKTSTDGKDVITRLSSKKTSTFFATIDDLLFSEKLITELLNPGGYNGY